MAKSPDAFRTISEVADWLGVEAHVLRFWETKFAQVKPVKRAGGRRYYRPSDMALLGGIRRLLHDDGMTIRGVQKVLREKGIGHVSGLSHELRVDGVELAAPSPARSVPRKAEPVDGGGRQAPAVTAGAPAADDDAPTLPFDLPAAGAPRAPAAPTVADEPSSRPSQGGDERSAANAAAPSRARPATAPAGDAPPAPARLRARPVRIDQAAASEVLARARALLERLRNTPE